MTPNKPADKLIIEGSLTADSGEVRTTIEAAGGRLCWSVSDVGAAIDKLPRVTRRQIATASRTLSSWGLAVEMVDRYGTLIEFGDVRRSALGWVLFGTASIRPRRLTFWLFTFLSHRK